MEEWMDSLRRADGALRPEAGALAEIGTAVRRRRRRRSAVTAVAAAAATAVVIGGVAIAVRGDGGPRDRVVSDPSVSTTAADPTSASEEVDPRRFSCPTESKVFDPSAAPVLDNETAQVYKKTYSEIAHRDFEGYALRRIEIFHAGVFVLVTGDLARAKRELASLGVAGVGLWDPNGPEVGLDEYGQLEQLIQWRLEPILREARRLTRGIPGSAGLAFWRDADAVLVQWKQPVPAEVRALEDIQFKTGGRILVEGVRYSQTDVRRAQGRLGPWLRRTGHWGDWSMAHACGDGSGLVVGMVPSLLAKTDVPSLQAEIAGAVGMPVMVVAEGRPVELGAGG